MPMQSNPARAEELIRALDLGAHVEGGWFRRSYQNDSSVPDTEHGPRPAMSSIYYLLARRSPVGHFHLNRSDILHYHHEGAALRYYLIHPDGRLETPVLGPDIAAGQSPQLLVPGGIWKATELPAEAEAGYALISEAVSPGFDYRDMRIGTWAPLLQRFPQHETLIRRLSYREAPPASG